MKKNSMIIMVLVFLVLLLAVFIAYRQIRPVSEEFYGALIDETKGQKISLDILFNDAEAYEGKNVIISGSTGQYCQASGCWVLLRDASRQMLVQFYDFTFRPPLNTPVVMQGTVLIKDGVPYLAATGLKISEESKN